MVNTSQIQSDMSNLSPKHDNLDKIIRKNLVNGITIDLVNLKTKNGSRVHHGEFNKHLNRLKYICPTINRNMVNKAMQLYRSSLMYEDKCTVVSNENNDVNDNSSRIEVNILS